MKTHHTLSLTGALMLALGHIGYVIGSNALTIVSVSAALPFFLPALAMCMPGQARRERLRSCAGHPQHAC